MNALQEYKRVFDAVEGALIRAGNESGIGDMRQQLDEYKVVAERRLEDADYYRLIIETTFYSGFTAATVDAKLDVIREWLPDYATVACYKSEHVQMMMADTRMIRNESKLWACIENARTFQGVLKEHGSFRGYVDSFTPEVSFKNLMMLRDDVMRRFAYLKGTNSLYFLMEIGMPVLKPDRVVTRIFYRLGLIEDEAIDEARLLRAVEIGQRFVEATGHPIRYIDIVFVFYGQVSGEGSSFSIQQGICLKTNPRCHICGVTGFCNYFNGITTKPTEPNASSLTPTHLPDKVSYRGEKYVVQSSEEKLTEPLLWGKAEATAREYMDAGRSVVVVQVSDGHIWKLRARRRAPPPASSLPEFLPLAEQGNPDAQVSLGFMYKHGQGVPRDYREAARWYRLAAEQGDADAQRTLGGMCRRGQGVPVDYGEAVRWYRLAAEQGSASAQVSLGTMYQQGHGVPQDCKEAARWYRLAAEQGDADAQVSLGFMYEYGEGVPVDYGEAARWYRLAAEQGDADAQRTLGGMYRRGQGVPIDYGEAVRWYRLAAEQGSASAQVSLGFMYRYGQGVPKDCREAVRWYRLAAEQGDADAQFQLGFMHDNGQGVPQDYEEAAQWYRLAGEQGEASAQFFLGIMYQQGHGVPQDDKEAVRWHHLAAEQGDASGQDMLGLMYECGRGVQRDHREAVRWYRLAAEQGNASAQASLGLMYEKGQGVLQDYVQAHMWFNLAGVDGNAVAAERRGAVADKMTPEQIAEAQRLAREWKPKNGTPR
jgi:TPR repeat protein/3-methyladenine DNA glycosylase Tag